jgi:hypothetical protein
MAFRPDWRARPRRLRGQLLPLRGLIAGDAKVGQRRAARLVGLASLRHLALGQQLTGLALRTQSRGDATALYAQLDRSAEERPGSNLGCALTMASSQGGGEDGGSRDKRAGNGSSVIGRIGGALLATVVMLLAGCDPPYLSDTYATSTPKPASFDTGDLARMPVVVLAFVAPGNLQGFSPTLSHALSGALTEVTPPIREIPTDETLNQLTDKGLATEYADLLAGFARNGMLDRQRLRRIGLVPYGPTLLACCVELHRLLNPIKS